MKLRLACLVAGSIVLLLASPVRTARADSVFVGSLERKNAIIKEIRDNNLIFEVSQREADPVPLARVTKLVVTNEPTLNAAEEAYIAGKFDQAVDGYQKTLRSTTKPWLKDWSAMRLIDAANKTGRFDAATTAYIAALMKDPTAAARAKPAMPDAKSTYLDTAVGEVNAALATPKITDAQKQALLTFLIELHRARKDTIKAGEAVEQLLKISSAGADNPEARRALADMKLSQARVALDAKDFAKAVSLIESAKATFVDPAQQAEAMYCIAEARFGQAQQTKDATALKDAGIAYMRVVAHFKDLPDKRHVADALLKTGAVYEQLGDPTTAAQLYEQVAREFRDDAAAAASARDNLNRLKSASGANR